MTSTTAAEPATSETADPSAHDSDECLLSDLGHNSDYMMSVTPTGVPQPKDLRVWTGEARTADEVAALPTSQYLVQSVTVDEVLHERSVGPSVEGRSPVEKQGTYLAIVPSDKGLGELRGSAIVLATSYFSEDGPVLRVNAEITPLPPTIIQAGGCETALNQAIERLDAGEDVFRRLLDIFDDPDFDAQVVAVDSPILPSSSEQVEAYEEVWASSVATDRSLQVGQVPPSLMGVVRVAGLFVDGTTVDAKTSVEIVVWSDVGVSYDVLLPAGSGPGVVVLPVEGELRVSVRAADGTLQAPTSSLDLAESMGSRTFLLHVAGDGTATQFRATDDVEFAKLMGTNVESLDQLQATYEAEMFYRGDPPTPGG